MPSPNDQLPTILRQLLRRIDAEPRAAAAAPAVRARDRLLRDLLPRTAGDTPYLVAGIVGPNNAGKSALFNSICGRPISPSSPTGGLTKRLWGAAHPDLLAHLEAEPTLKRFLFRRADDLTPEQVEAAAEGSNPPEELLISSVADMPPGLLLIDTPDFDSIMLENRAASESLLAVADLALAVVTRHTYQNREVVEYLQRWLSHGRPWILVYNEAPNAELALSHTEKLASDLDSRPLAVFWSPHDLELQEGRGRLEPVSAEAIAQRSSVSLRDFLFDQVQVAEVKSNALRASLNQLDDDLLEWCALLEERRADADRILDCAREHAYRAALQIAGGAMPGEPFIAAFRIVLDRRSNELSRRWRMGLRRARLKLEAIPSLFRRSKTAEESDSTKPGAKPADSILARAEAEILERVWPSLWESIVRDLGVEAREGARARISPDLRAALDERLAPEFSKSRLESVRVRIAQTAPDVESFREACEALIEDAISRRGRDWDIQAAVDVTLLAPLAIGATVILKTGGLGSDVGVAGGAAVSSYLMEKYSHLLGSKITADAQLRWAELRADQLGPPMVEAILGEIQGELDEGVRASAQLAADIQRLRKEIMS